MSQTPNTAITVIGIDIGKNSFHVVGHDTRGAIVLRQKWSRGQVEARLVNIAPCQIARKLRRRTSPEPQTRIAWSRCQVDAGQCPPIQGTEERLQRCRSDCRSRAAPDDEVRGDRDRRATGFQALHRGRERVTTTGIINQIRAFTPNAGSPCARVSASCARKCPPSLRRAPMPCRHACCVSSRSRQATGADWISASTAYPARSKHWPVEDQHVRADDRAWPGLPLRAPRWPRSARETYSPKAATSAPGLDWCPTDSEETARSSAKYRGAAIATCAFCLCRRHGLCWSR